jgi:hypothetical protein
VSEMFPTVSMRFRIATLVDGATPGVRNGIQRPGDATSSPGIDSAVVEDPLSLPALSKIAGITREHGRPQNQLSRLWPTSANSLGILVVPATGQ